MIKIVMDCHGGDNSPSANVNGALDAMDEDRDFNIVFCGNREEIEKILAERPHDKSRVEIIEAEEVISCEEQPTDAIRKKPGSSLMKAIAALDQGADAVVSTGSTGALLTACVLKIGRIKGVSRPALMPVLPSMGENGSTVFLDVGANADCKPVNLFHFALMGSVYASEVLGIKNPRVALLSNGAEDAKGNELTKRVNKALRECNTINFVGNVEACNIISGCADVVVADGFSGNLALKGMEGLSGAIFASLKEEISKSFRAKLGALFMKKSLRAVKHKLDYSNKGGAIFLGIGKVVVKAHGSAKALAVKYAVLQAKAACEHNLTDLIQKKIESTPVPDFAGQS